jgi:hypothetical protein
MELAFVLKGPLQGPGCSIFDVLRATEYVVPALEILDSRIQMEGRAIVDTISDNAAMGVMVTSGRPVRPDDIDLRWVSGLLYRNQTIEETGGIGRGAEPSGVGGGVACQQDRAARCVARRGRHHPRRLVHPPNGGVPRRYSVRGLRNAREHHMSLRVNEHPLTGSFSAALESTGRPLAGMWICSGNSLVAEICAGSGLDWLLIDAEHSPNGLESLLAQLQAVHGYPTLPVIRPPVLDPVIVKQYLDLGAQTLLIPMVDTADLARLAVSSSQYPPAGIRGVGSALARASR